MKPVSIALLGGDIPYLRSVEGPLCRALNAEVVQVEPLGNALVDIGLAEQQVVAEGMDCIRAEAGMRKKAMSFVTTRPTFYHVTRISMLYEKFAQQEYGMESLMSLGRAGIALQQLTSVSATPQFGYSAIYALPCSDEAPDGIRNIDKQTRIVMETLDMPYEVLYGSVKEIVSRIVSDVEEAAAKIGAHGTDQNPDRPAAAAAAESPASQEGQGEVPDVS